MHTHIYIYRHVSAHIHTYDAWPTSHAQYTQHTYTHACIHALMHQCIHIKAIVVCICTYIYIHTYRAQNTDITCIRICITYIAWIHIVHSMEQGTRNKESKHTVNTLARALALRIFCAHWPCGFLLTTRQAQARILERIVSHAGSPSSRSRSITVTQRAIVLRKWLVLLPELPARWMSCSEAPHTAWWNSSKESGRFEMTSNCCINSYVLIGSNCRHGL